MPQETTQEVGTPTSPPSAEEARAELFRMLDELATSRTVDSARLSARFRELWPLIAPGEGPTVH